MNSEVIAEMFNGISDTWRQILCREPESKRLLVEALGKVTEAVGTKPISALTPPAPLILNAFKLCPWEKLCVVLIGQDPYSTAGDANGLCFSVNKGVAVPLSLKNIYAALIKSGYMTEAPITGDISSWATQGILMLNMALTTMTGERGSHLAIWQKYTENIVSIIAKKCAVENRVLVFVLWGTFAQKISKIVNKINQETLEAKMGAIHRILEWGHPSPVNASNRGDVDKTPKHFANCDNFIKTNTILAEFGKRIDWAVK